MLVYWYASVLVYSYTVTVPGGDGNALEATGSQQQEAAAEEVSSRGASDGLAGGAPEASAGASGGQTGAAPKAGGASNATSVGSASGASAADAKAPGEAPPESSVPAADAEGEPKGGPPSESEMEPAADADASPGADGEPAERQPAPKSPVPLPEPGADEAAETDDSPSEVEVDAALNADPKASAKRATVVTPKVVGPPPAKKAKPSAPLTMTLNHDSMAKFFAKGGKGDRG